MITLKEYDFNNNISTKLKKEKHGTNWPVVYILNNKEEAYIGETTDISIRSNQHLAKEIRKKLMKINIITDETFNKSVILDLESFLIKYMSADKTFKLQNSNGGMQNHNYYQREEYEKKFKEIWKKLKTKGLVKNALREIENSDLFKFSPYKSLTADQYMIVNEILNVLAKNIEAKQNTTFIIHGGAGTGKTVLGIYLLKLISQAKDSEHYEIEEDQVEQNLYDILKINETVEDLRIGLVIPMENLRETLKKVFKYIKGLNSNMVLSPNDVAKNNQIYDLLIVDEAHRLRQRKNLSSAKQYNTFKLNNIKLGLDENEGTELDWILKKSKYQIFFYDEKQTIKPTDVRKEKFIELLKQRRKLDIIKGYTTKGVHRDDFNIFINNKEVSVYGSQGQNRTVVLSLKLAELQVIKDDIDDYPILLLDDFMSELDSNRRKSFLNNIENTQVIITCTDPI